MTGRIRTSSADAIRILIVKLGAIGDVLRTTAILPGLQKKHGRVEIDWLTAPASREVLERNSYLRRIFIWEERASIGDYDIVIGLDDEMAACEFVTQVKAKEKIGVFLEKDKINYTPSAWFDMSRVSRLGLEQANRLKKKNRQTYQQLMGELLGIGVAPYIFNLSEDEINYGKAVIEKIGLPKGKSVVGINTGAGGRWQLKSWGSKPTIELIKRLRDEEGVYSLILGGEAERERNAKLAAATGMPEAGNHSLRQFASIINQLPLVLSSDSLAMHLAIALRRRVIVFFGPTSAAEIELYGLGRKLQPQMDCLVCYKKKCDFSPNCMELLSVDSVLTALKEELATAR